MSKIQELTKIQDEILKLDDQSRNIVIQLIEILSSRNSIPQDLNILDCSEIQEIEESGFTSSSLDSFQTPEKIEIKTKEEEKDIEEFSKDLEKPNKKTKEKQGSKKVAGSNKELILLEKLNILQDFKAKYKEAKILQMAKDLYEELNSTYSKKLPWKEIYQEADKYGYVKESYPPKLRYAAVLMARKGWIKEKKAEK